MMDFPSLSIVHALALGAFTTYFLEAASRGLDRLLNARVRPCFNPELTVEGANNAFERFKKNHQGSYKFYLKLDWFTEETEKEHVFRQRTLDWLKNGNCHGQISHLLQIIKEANGSLKPEMIDKLDAEVVFYRQHLHNIQLIFQECFQKLETSLQFNAFVNKQVEIEEMKYSLALRGYASSKRTNFNKESYKQKKLDKPKKESENLKEICWHDSASRSPHFWAGSSVENYAEILESTIPSKDPIVGALHMHQHIFAFQYSSEGYYIYDCISAENGGLFKYPDKETFFQKLREQTLSDLEAIEAKCQADISKDISFSVLNLTQ